MLQFTLSQLYERRTEADGTTRLTHSAYEALGGLQGAIAAEAERAVSTLPPGTLDALPRLLRQLAEPAHDGKTLTLREVAQTDAVADQAEAALVSALLGARILVAGQDAAARPTLRMAHDAVLTSWPKAHDAAQASREFYRVRAEVEDSLGRWQEHGRQTDRLIQPGVPLAEAEKLVADFRRELPNELVAFVRISRDRARVRQRLIAAAAMFFLCLAVAATGASIWAYRAQQQALAERDRALLNDSQRLLDLIEAAKPGDPITTALLSLEGLPGLTAEEQRPYLAPLEANLYPSVDQLREVLVIDHPITSPDNRRLAKINPDFSVSVYDIDAGSELFVLKGHQADINAVAFSDNGKLIATASADKTARLWNAETGEAIAILSLHTGPVTFVAFNDSDHSVMTVSDDGSIRRWSASDGKPLAVFPGHEGGVRQYAASYLAHRLASVSRGQVVRLWDLDTGRLLSRPDSDDPSSLTARQIEGTLIRLNDDGTRLVITRLGPTNSVILWDTQAGQSLATFDQAGFLNEFVDDHRLLQISRPGLFDVRTDIRFVDAATGKLLFSEPGFPIADFKGNRFLVTNNTFSIPVLLWDATTFTKIGELPAPPESMALAEFVLDGKQIVTAPKDGTIKLWNPETGELIRSISIAYDDAALGIDGNHAVVTLHQGGAQVWDLQTGEKALDLDTRKDTFDDQSPLLPAVNLTVSSDGKRAAARLGQLQTVRLWDLTSTEVSEPASARRLLDAESPQEIQAFRLNTNGTKLLVQGKTQAEIWALPNLDLAATIDNVEAMQFSEGGHALIVTKKDKFGKPELARVWRIATDTGLFKGSSLTGLAAYGILAPQEPQPLVVVASSDDMGRLGLSAPTALAGTNAIELVDLGTGRVVRALAAGAASDFGLTPVVAASADGRRLLTGLALTDGRQVWDTGSGSLLMEVKPDPVDALISRDAYLFSDDGKRLCVVTIAGDQAHVSIWDVDGRARIASGITKIENLDANGILANLSVKFSADGLRINVVLRSLQDSRARILVFDAQTAALKRDLGSPNENQEIVASPRGTWFLLLSKDSDDTQARLLNSDSGLVTKLQLPVGQHDAWFSDDERKFVVASAGNAGLWDPATGSPLHSCSIGNDADWIRYGAFSPDDASIALGTATGAVYICDAASGNLRKLFAGSPSSPNPVGGLSFSGDGRWLSISGTRTTVVKNLDGDPAVVASMPDTGAQMTFAADHHYLVTGKSVDDFSGVAVHRLFPTTASLVEYARSKLPRCLTPIERKQYHLFAEPPLWCVEMAKWPYDTAEWGKWLEARQSGKRTPLPADPRFPAD